MPRARHWSSTYRFVFAICSSEVAPEDTIIGFPVSQTRWMSGKKLLPPEAILHASTKGPRKAALSKSKGVDMNSMPREWVRDARFANCSNDSSKDFSLLNLA